MKKFNMCTFDIEICKSPDDCTRGWASHDEMGIAVMAVCHHDAYPDYRIELFNESTMEEGLKSLASADMISGFNSVLFDMKVLLATAQRLGIGDKFYELGLDDKPHYDMYQKIKETGVFMRAKGIYNLGTIAERTIGRSKTDHGANAPLMFQSGEIQKLHEYCIEDVKIEADLVRFVEQHQYLINGNGEQVYMTKPSHYLMMLKGV